MSEITVTGANGFIGTNVLLKLKDDFNKIHAVTTQKKDEIKFDNKINWVTHDLNHIDDLTYEKLGSPKVLIHLAWSGLRNLNCEKHLTDYYLGHLNFIKYMIDCGVETIFISGTCQEYKLQDNTCLSEKSEVIPFTNYARAKNNLRIEIEKYIRNKECKLIWGRIFYLYGSFQQKQTLFGQFSESLNSRIFEIKNPDLIRDYLCVQRLAEYIIELLKVQEKYTVVNLCSGKPIKIYDLVNNWRVTYKALFRIKSQSNLKNQLEKEVSFWGDNSFLLKILENLK
jgi:nucleoside-diphosphate-sugar epimerase